MIFYHSTKLGRKEKIIKEKKINSSSNFDYHEYIDYLMSIAPALIKNDKALPPKYPLAKRNAYFMGLGIYCFDNYFHAKCYQKDCEIVEVEYENKYDFIDFDNPLHLRDVYLELYNFEETINKLDLEEEFKVGYVTLIELLKRSIDNDFCSESLAVGTIIEFLIFCSKNFNEKSILEKADVISKSFLDTRVNGSKYYLIKNNDKILNLC